MSTLPSNQEMYAALCRRDESFDGLFFAGVRTTGIFCRPVCSARKPRKENVEFFANREDALRAGFRPCLRCRPLEPTGAHPEWVQRLLDELKRPGSARVTDEKLRELAIEPARARRYFRERFGTTFQAWQRAQRLGLALARLHEGSGIDEAGLDAGFESTSGFREAFERWFGAPPGQARQGRCLVLTEIESPLGPLVAAATPEGVALLEFADRPALRTQARTLRRWFDLPIAPGTNEHLEQLERELAQYFAGEREGFEVPLQVAGSPFQRAVWERLLAIPYGETRSYEDVAEELGRSGAQRAVGRANGDNRLAIVIPCHRVVQKDGSLRGYGGGLWRKRFLLELERGAATGSVNAATSARALR